MPAPTAPTSLAINQIYTRTDDEFMQHVIVRSLTQLRNSFSAWSLPAYEERWIELRWTETEAGECDYLVKLGSDVLQRLPKGVGRARVLIGRRERVSISASKAEYSTLPDWGANFSGTFNVTAVNGDGESSPSSLTVNQALATVTPAILPIVELDTAAGGGTLRWSPDVVGAWGTLVSIYRGSSIVSDRITAADAFVRAPGTSLQLPHQLRRLIDDETVIMPSIFSGTRGVLLFINGESYTVRLQPMVFDQQIGRQGRFRYGYVRWLTPLVSSSVITWGDAPTDMILEPQQVSPVVGVATRFEIPINVTDAEWAVTAGEQSWASLDPATGVLDIVAPSTTPVTVTVSATKDSTTKTTQIRITPRPRPNPPTVRVSITHLANGYSFRQGEAIVIEPSAAGGQYWRATLPDGLRIDERSGRIFGSVLEVGRYTLSIQARSEDSDWSAPLELPLKITAVPANVDLASVRFGWLQTEWKLTDLQVSLTDRGVSTSRLVARSVSTAGPEGVLISQVRRALVIKPRDRIKFAVMFLLGNQSQTLADLEKIRIGIRPENNVDDPIFFETNGSPAPVEIEGAVYYLIEGTLSEDAGDQIMDTLKTKNEPLPAIADVEWTVDGEVYSSQTFPVDLELDVTRDG